MKWDAIRQVHGEAAAAVAASAERIGGDQWSAARAEGKWSPAEVIEHLNLAYDVLLAEMAGGPGMRIKTRPLQRIMLRMMLLPKLLRGQPFPKGIPAPREIRPAVSGADQHAAITSFKAKAQQFDAAAAKAIADGSGVRLTHPYFGKGPLDN